jgi:hypothetical protein
MHVARLAGRREAWPGGDNADAAKPKPTLDEISQLTRKTFAIDLVEETGDVPEAEAGRFNTGPEADQEDCGDLAGFY